MTKLNPKQQTFADEYIITGNATRAMIKAGYSEKYANTNSPKLLQNTTIKNYIEKRMKEITSERLLSMEEALTITASIAKGEPQQFVSRELDPETGEVITEERREFSAGFKERNQALEHFYKINGAFIDKQEITNIAPPVFEDDILGDADG